VYPSRQAFCASAHDNHDFPMPGELAT